MKKLLGFTMIAISAAGTAFGRLVDAPEIDASMGASALALLSGALLVLRNRRNKR